MNKSELIEAIADGAELTKAGAARAMDAMLDAIRKSLKKGKPVTIVGFGTFLVRERKAREGRNPQTGEKIRIKKSRVPAFKAGKAFKDAI